MPPLFFLLVIIPNNNITYFTAFVIIKIQKVHTRYKFN